MTPRWTRDGWADYLDWAAAPEALRRINALIADTQRTPFQGLGRPTLLKGDLAGLWSRRIAGDHRLVYRVTGRKSDPQLEIIACRYHP